MSLYWDVLVIITIIFKIFSKTITTKTKQIQNNNKNNPIHKIIIQHFYYSLYFKRKQYDNKIHSTATELNNSK